MAVFSYRARDLNGLLIMGQMESDAMDSVRDNLSEQGLIPVSVTKGAGKFKAELNFDFMQGVKNDELMLFTRQFHTLFKAGMDMDTLLNTLAGQTNNKFFQEAILRIRTDVSTGSSLSRAFAQHPKIFSDLYINMLATGEEAGILDSVLGQLATILEKEMTLKSSVSSALLYPKIVMFVLVLATLVIMYKVMPQFVTFYGNFKAELPLSTRFFIATSNFMRDYWYIFFGSIGASYYAFIRWSSTSRGKVLWDQIKFKFPVFGSLGIKVANARFCNIVGALYQAGLPITRGLEITALTIGNAAFGHEVLLVKADVEKGRGIAESMRGRLYFSPLIVESTAIGEKSGAIDELYRSVGSHYDTEVAHTLKNMATLLEPMILFVVFGMVTVFALAIFMPMISMSSAVTGKH